MAALHKSLECETELFEKFARCFIVLRSDRQHSNETKRLAAIFHNGVGGFETVTEPFKFRQKRKADIRPGQSVPLYKTT